MTRHSLALAIGSVLLTVAVAATAPPAAATTPTLPGPLFGIDALTAYSIWAVGSRPNPDDPDHDEFSGLVEHWDGTDWTEQTSPGFGELTGGLNDVAAISSTDVWAVGDDGQPSFRDTQLVIEHFDGNTWTIATAPHPSFHEVLSGVDGAASNDVWAVGAYSTGGTGLNHMLIEHWNGSKWSVTTTPNISAQLTSVVAIARNDVWGIGATGGKTLTMHWDGSAWTTVPSPNQGTHPNSLVDVSAASGDDVWAVGTVDTGQPFPGRTLAIHWNETSWKLVPSPSPSSGDTVTGVSVLDDGTAWMVGTYWPTAFRPVGLTERFGGGRWRFVEGIRYTTLEGVAAVARDDAWAVGSAIYRWDGSTWQLVVAPTP